MPNTDASLTRYARALIRWRWLFVIAPLLLVAAMASGAKHIEITNNYRAFFSSENPELNAFEALEKIYTKNDNIMFVVKPKGGVFSASSLAMIEEITEASWQIPYAIRVDSITNFQHTTAVEDDIAVADLVSDPEALTPEDLAALADIATSEPLLYGRLLSHDRATTAVNVTLQLPQKSLAEVPEAVKVVREMVTELRANHPHVEFALTGAVMLNNAFAESPFIDLRTLFPIMYGLLIAGMALLFRSVVGTIGTILVILLSSAAGMGFAGHMGWKLTGVEMAAGPIIILTVAIADSIHLLLGFFSGLANGTAKNEALTLTHAGQRRRHHPDEPHDGRRVLEPQLQRLAPLQAARKYRRRGGAHGLGAIDHLPASLRRGSTGTWRFVQRRDE